MKQSKYFDLIISGILVPLWVILIFELIKNLTRLNLAITAITSAIILAIFIRAAYEALIETNLMFKLRCRGIDSIVRKTQKKLQKVISGTYNASVMNYAVKEMCELYKPEVCTAILGELADKERNPDKQRNLNSYKEIIGGNK